MVEEEELEDNIKKKKKIGYKIFLKKIVFFLYLLEKLYDFF